MRKLVCLMLCGALAMAFALAGCSGGEQQETPAPSVEEENGAELANPWVECATLEEAEQLAGFDIALPFEPIEGDLYTVMPGNMIQVTNTVGGTITVRKGVGTEDVSGDYNTYAYETVVDDIAIKGFAENEVVVAMWTVEGYSYSLSYGDPISEADMLAAAHATK